MFLNLTNRSEEKELMDDPMVDQKALDVALSDVSRVNKLLGGNGITINAVFKQIARAMIVKEWTIVDLGSGDGEMLRQIADQARKLKIKVKLIGLDINDKCVLRSKQLSVLYPEISYYNKSFISLTKEELYCDIMICTLTFHHMKNEEIKNVIYKSKELVSTSLIINDLHRNSIAYFLFKIFSFFFIKGHIAKHDGLVSIKRGFKRIELMNLAKELNLHSYQLDWKWAFRYRWIIQM
ncbi:class I SAM-dependent methyltransferase [Aquimarina addita]|uniref:Class I SAM-dependent methyltransferase n=1 Tax=Aquimarina addita TaxID=870485 RepID=A0ABP6UL60_9FLAO